MGSWPPPSRPTPRTLMALPPWIEEAAADVGVGVADGVLELLQRDAVALEPLGVGVDLVALDVPPKLVTSMMRGTRRNSRSSTQSCSALRSLRV